MAIKRFEEIDAWKQARKVNKVIYKHSGSVRFAKDFALRDQMRRASTSVMSNIAEGFDSGSDREFAHFLGYSLRSASEVQSHLYVALDQAYLSEQDFNCLYGETVTLKNLIYGFIRYIKRPRPNDL
jgi:four helix bundle protein